MQNINYINYKLFSFLNKVILLLFLFTFFINCAPAKKAPPKAVKGILDLREWDFERDGNINLDGEWEFFWRELPKTENLVLSEERKEFLEVPRPWNDYTPKNSELQKEKINGKVGGIGFATYRLKVLLGKNTHLSIRSPNQGTAYELYVDNVFLFKSGKVTQSAEDFLEGRSVDYLDLSSTQEEINFLFTISNHNHRDGGLWFSVTLGKKENIRKLQISNLSMELFVSGILFIMGIYHLSLFLLRGKDRSPLYFGLYCLLISLRTLITGDKFLHSLYPNLNTTLSLKLEYIPLYFGLPVFFEFLYSLFYQEVNQFIRKTILSVCSILTLMVVFLPSIIYTKTLIGYEIFLILTILYLLFILIKAVQNKREGSVIFLSGYIIFALVIVNDILHDNNTINTGYFAPWGFVVFIFSQSFLLTSRFAGAFKRVEDLSQNLEKKVEERTLTLDIANREISASRKETEELNDLIKSINSVYGLTDVMRYVMYYLGLKYGYNTFWLVLFENKNSKINTSVCESSTLSEEASQYLKSLSLYPEELYSLCDTFRAQKLNYLEINDSRLSIKDTELLETVGFSYLFHLPYVIYGECIGILTLHKVKGESISIEEQNELVRFTEHIAGAVYNSILYQDSQKARELAELSFRKTLSLNEKIQVIIQSKSIDEIFERIYDQFSQKYGLNAYVVYILDKENGLINVFKIYGNINADTEFFNVLYKNQISIKDQNSIHRLCILKNKSFLTTKVRLPNPCKIEEDIILHGGINAFYIVPLVIDNESFGSISFSDNKFQRSDIDKLTKIEREEIENFVKLISPSIYQSLQKTIIENAYSNLQETQAQLLEAERLASLGQLVGGIAHEINNPISVIRSNAELLESNSRYTLFEIPLFLESLTVREKEIFYEIVDGSLKNNETLSTREERLKKKEILKEISKIGSTSEEELLFLTEQILILKLSPPYLKYLDELNYTRWKEFLTKAQVFKNQANSLSSIEIAVEKASRVVFALRSYLNTDQYYEKREVNLVEEIEKSLKVYDNYIIGKINITKEFPNEIIYSCIAENLSQVWKNIIFNAVQAMYNTEKRMEIKIKRVENIPATLKDFKSSSIVEDFSIQNMDNSRWILVSIKDFGLGIPLESQNKVFTPFFTTKSLGEGIGLGLYVCKKIVNEHGGFIFFKSEEGNTEFIVALPEK
jgi:signal transduction histidine kinase